MKRTLPLLFIAALGAYACGGRTPPSSTSAADHEDGERDLGEGARLALVDGDLDGAERLAEDALRSAPADTTAQQVAARIALAKGDHERVIALLSAATRPTLVRLRARARYAAGDLAGAGRDLESVEGQDPPDGWADAVMPLARAGAVLSCYRVDGAERATLPFVGRSPLPVIAVTVDGREVHALVATQADLTIVDDGLRASAGILGRLGLGAIVMENVPALVRDLGPIGEQVGVEVSAVLGLDVLLRLGVTIDFRERWLVLAPAGTEASADAAAASFYTLGGSFLAVDASLDESHDAILAVDTAGPFPLAISDRLAEALGHDLATLPRAEGAPTDEIRMLTVAQLRVGAVTVSGVPAATGLLPPELSELAGAPVDGIIGAIALQQMRLTIDGPNRQLLFD